MAFIDDLFKSVSGQGFSDLLLLTGEVPLIRKGRTLLKTEFGVVSATDAEQVLSEIMPESNLEEFRSKHDTHFAYECEGVGRFRCNVFMDSKGWCAAFRLVPNTVLPFDKLGLPPAAKKLCYLRKGLVVVSGDAGSGRTTTLASLIDIINETRGVHVVTLENPVEYIHQNKRSFVNQRSIRNHTASLASGLAAAMEEGPEVVMLGDLGDLETAEGALEAATAGVLVFASMNTPDALTTVTRLIELYPPSRETQAREVISLSLKGVLAQCLCKRTDGRQSVAAELLLVTPSVARNIREGRLDVIPETIAGYKSAGMQALNDSLTELAVSEAITPEEAYIKAVDKDDLVGRLKAKGIRVEADEILG